MRVKHAFPLVIFVWASCRQLGILAVSNDDVAGPIVKLSELQAKPENNTRVEESKENKPGTIAQLLDAALQKEFTKETSEDGKGGSNFNATVQQEEAKLETVVRIAGKATAVQQATAASSSNSTESGGEGGGGGSDADGGKGDGVASSGGNGASNSTTSDAGADVGTAVGVVEVEPDVDRIIDSQDNEFVLSKPNESVASLTLDQQLIRDISVLLVAAAVFGMLFEAVRQPVINGYLIGGAVVGPGGLNLVNELVQVESLAQLGVQLLLFGLGLELSFTKLRAVWGVAVLGGTLQIVLLSLVCGLVAAAAGAPLTQGVFVGALLSMSSTAVVVKCLEVMRSSSSAYGQITTGTLLLQDCMVGVMFALLPLFNSGLTAGPPVLTAGQDVAEAKGRAVLLVLSSGMRLVLAVVAALLVAKTALSPLLKLTQRQASRELVQLSLVALCVGISSFSHLMGLSSELGAFVAGVMVNVALGPGSTHGSSSSSGADNANGTGGSVAAVVMQAMAPMSGIVPMSGSGGGGGGGVSPTGVVVTHGSAAIAGEDGGPELRNVLPKAKASDSDTEWILEREGLLATEDAREREWEREREKEKERERERERERHRARDTLGSHAAYYSIESARNVLVALFMASIGLIMSPRFLMDHLGVLTVGVGLVVLVKGALVATVVRGFSVGLRTSLAVGLSMAHVGEFAFVLLSHAVQSGLLPLQVYMLLLGVTALSLLTTPFIVLLAMHWVLPKDGGGGISQSSTMLGPGLHVLVHSSGLAPATGRRGTASVR
ncbi:hypothetical protein Vretimale_14445 [Volvox reticuliferus]|uniref:Cation/H+ exchanger transmembrane domain-containing protein n=1 Tax=Volvox reticuliferus TaxID=1737510 RepID=A0A8J4LUQ2_9CHLO|nr:hypothetical protein Vretifemale_13218 [Volvox reticuliferus]GIM10828.1 hypothetical protein Vretimale_14445 [Volvox reticuliferus]